MEVVIYDLEDFPNFFSYTDINRDTQKIIQLYIHESKNDIKELLEYLASGLMQVGFNNINYDYPLLHYILINKEKLKDASAEEILYHLYRKSQAIIDAQRADNKFEHAVPEWNHRIPQLDLYKIWHFDNKNKRTSLKDVQIAINYPRVQDLPLPYDHIVQENDIEMILDYNLNDVLSTYEFYKVSKPRIDLRRDLGKEFNLKLMNRNDPAIGSDIFLKYICEEEDLDPKDVKQMRTWRSTIDLNQCILPYIEFDSKEFTSLLKRLKV
jgi:hypothetical protein